MKKLFALLLFLIFCLALFSCGKDEADYVVDSVVNLTSSLGESEFFSLAFADTSSLKVSVSVDNFDGVGALVKSFESIIGKVNVPDIRDARADMYFDFQNSALAQIGTATVDGERLEMAAYENLQKIAVTSNLLNPAYGADTKTALGWVVDDGSYEILSQFATVLSKTVKFFSRFTGEFINSQAKDLLRDNVDITKEKDGKNLILSFTVTKSEAEAMLADFSKLPTVSKDVVALLEKAIENSDIVIDASFTVEKKTAVLLEAKLDISNDGDKLGTVSYSYSAEKDIFEVVFVTDGGEHTVTLAGTLDSESKSEYSLSFEENIKDGEFSYEAETVFDLTVEDGELHLEYETESLYDDGKDKDHSKLALSLKASYEVSENTINLKIVNLGYGSMKFDISKYIGIGIEIEKNPAMPTFPQKIETLDTPNEFKLKYFYKISDKLGSTGRPIFEKVIDILF